MLALGEVLSNQINHASECVEKIKLFIESAQSNEINEAMGVSNLDWVSDKVQELQNASRDTIDQLTSQHMEWKQNMTQPELRDHVILFLINMCHIGEAIVRENRISEVNCFVFY